MEKSINIFAILGFVFSFLIPIIGLILSIIAITQVKENDKGYSFAIAGITISSIFILLSIVLLFSLFI